MSTQPLSPEDRAPPTPTPAAAEDTARTAGRGGLAVLGAKVFFIVAGFVQQPLLKLAVGLSDFGGLAQALVVANTVNNVVISSGTQGVSRAVAGAPGHEDEALRATLKVHAVLAVAIGVLVVLAAPLYAVFEKAEDVIAPLVVLAGVALLYGLYAPLIGYLNGRKRFTKQAGLDVTFAVLRTLGLIGVGYFFVRRGASGVLGTTVGWVAAAACIVPLALRATGFGKAAPERAPGVPSARAYLGMLLPIAGAQLCTNLLMQVDIAMLGRFLSDAAEGSSLEAKRDLVKQWVAIYKECQTFAFLPYQLLFSVTLVLFPMLARARAEGDEAAVRRYVMRGARLGAIVCGLLVGVVVAVPESLLGFAYGAADAARGAPVLRVLALAQAAFAMLGIATTILTSLGRERTSAVLTLIAFGAVAGACVGLAAGAPFGAAMLVRTATATAVALTASLVVAGVVVVRYTGGFVPAATALRVGFVLAGCFGAGLVVPRVGRLMTPVAAAVAAGVYLVALVVLREIGKQDLADVRTMTKR
jgi:stage V sporulation protein B